MYILISVTREALEICESFYPTRDAAHKAMVKDILISTRYNTVDEIRRDAESGKCGLTDEDAWAETFSEGTCAWKIVEVPEETNMVSHTALDKEDENAVDANGVSLAEKKAFLCETFGNGICEKAGADFYEFAYRAVKEHGLSLMDIDRWAFLNTIFGYDIGADVARRISAWYEENGMDVLELADPFSLYLAEMELGIRLVYDEVPDTLPAVIRYDWNHKEEEVIQRYFVVAGGTKTEQTVTTITVRCKPESLVNFNMENMLRLAAARYARKDLTYRHGIPFMWYDDFVYAAAKMKTFKEVCEKMGLTVTVEEITTPGFGPYEILYKEGRTHVVTDIQWDLSKEKQHWFLPKETVVHVDDEVEIADVLTKKYGYPVLSYRVEPAEDIEDCE